MKAVLRNVGQFLYIDIQIMYENTVLSRKARLTYSCTPTLAFRESGAPGEPQVRWGDNNRSLLCALSQLEDFVFKLKGGTTRLSECRQSGAVRTLKNYYYESCPS